MIVCPLDAVSTEAPLFDSRPSFTRQVTTGLMQTLAIEGGNYGITVNCLAPSAATQMTQGVLPETSLKLLDPALVSPALLALAGENAPTRTILCAGGGHFACAGVTLKAVSTALDIPLKSGQVSAEGDLDFRGTLGVAKDAPVGFAQIRLTFDVETDAPQDKLDQLLKLTERYCVIYQTIKCGPPIDVRMDVDRPMVR